MATTKMYSKALWNAVRGEKYNPDLDEGTTRQGDYVMPDDFIDAFNTALAKDNLFRRYATVVQAAPTNDRIEAVASTGEAEFVGEGVAFPDNADSFTEFKLNPCKLAALTRIKEDFVRDTKFDLEGYLSGEFARRFGRAEEKAFITGDGVTQPCGILNDTGGAPIGVTAKEYLTFDEITCLFFSLSPEYRRNAVWIMNDTVAFHLRSLKDSGGMRLWNHNSNTIFGLPVEISPYMPNAEAGTKPIVIADLRYYWICERRSLAVKILRELFSLKGEVGIAAHEILDGRLILPEAARVLQMAE